MRYDDTHHIRNLETILRKKYGYTLVRAKGSKDSTLHKRFRLKDNTGKIVCGKGKPVSYDQIVSWICKQGGLRPLFKNAPAEFEDMKMHMEFAEINKAHEVNADFPRLPLSNKYLITNTGHVVNIDKFSFNAMSKLSKSQPYIHYGLPSYGDTANIYIYAHKYVAVFFCPNKKGKRIVHHIDLNKRNNYAANLLWVTDSEHWNLHGLYNKGDMEAYYRRVLEIYEDNQKETA